jgi:hypothetical protein
MHPPGTGMTRMRSLSISSHSSSGMGWRLIARCNGGDSGAGSGKGGAGGASRARATVAAVDRLVKSAPHAAQVRSSWLMFSQTPHRHVAFIGSSAFRECEVVCRRGA